MTVQPQKEGTTKELEWDELVLLLVGCKLAPIIGLDSPLGEIIPNRFYSALQHVVQ